MIRMFVRHDVADYGVWRRAYDAFDAERRQMGVVGDAVYPSAERERDVTAHHDFETLETAKAFIGSQRLREVMGAAGVTSVPTIWFTRLVRGGETSPGNVGLVKSLYEAFGRGDVPAVLGAMDPAIVWNEAENFPYADKNPYVGPGAVAAGVFGRIVAEWEGFTVTPEEFHDAGEAVIARGRYGGAHKQTGKRIHVQFAHFWWLKGGKVVRFQQHADTLQVAKAAGA